jgi:hypothetical protein
LLPLCGSASSLSPDAPWSVGRIGGRNAAARSAEALADAGFHPDLHPSADAARVS